MPRTADSVSKPTASKGPAQLTETSKKELNRAIDTGQWESVGELAVLLSDSSFAVADELNSTLVDESHGVSLSGETQNKNLLPTSELDQKIDSGATPEDVTPKTRLNLEIHNTDSNSKARSTIHNRENVSTFAELEDPSGLFLSIQDDRLGGERLSRPPERWAILALAFVVMFGINYSLDIPAALHQELKDYMPSSLKFEVRFNLLYTLYSLPNVALPIFAGNIVDRLGASQCLLGCALITLSGQMLFSFGTETRNWLIMLLGRMMYGVGGGSSCVAYSTLLSRWFVGSDVAMSFGASLAVSRLGSVLNNIVSPLVAHMASTPWALWTGVLFNSMSAVMALVILIIDQRSSQSLRENSQRDLAEPLLQAGIVDPANEEVNEARGRGNTTHVHFSDILQFGPLFWLLSLSCLLIHGCIVPFNNVASGILLERNYFMTPPPDCVLDFPNQCTLGRLQNLTNPSTNSKGDLCPSRNYAPILPTSLNITDSSGEQTHEFDSLSSADVDCNDDFWASACTRDFCEAQNKATVQAGRIMSIPYIISAFFSPILGHVVDKIGQRAIISSLASLILVCVHVTLGLTRISPVVPLIGQGMVYALYATALLSSVPLTVDENLTGTAFGIIMSIQHIGLSLYPLIIAGIYRSNGNAYLPSVEIFFVISACLGFAIGVFLIVLDRKRGNMLNCADGTGDGTDVSVRSNETVFSDVHAENIIHK